MLNFKKIWTEDANKRTGNLKIKKGKFRMGNPTSLKIRDRISAKSFDGFTNLHTKYSYAQSRLMAKVKKRRK